MCNPYGCTCMCGAYGRRVATLLDCKTLDGYVSLCGRLAEALLTYETLDAKVWSRLSLRYRCIVRYSFQHIGRNTLGAVCYFSVCYFSVWESLSSTNSTSFHFLSPPASTLGGTIQIALPFPSCINTWWNYIASWYGFELGFLGLQMTPPHIILLTYATSLFVGPRLEEWLFVPGWYCVRGLFCGFWRRFYICMPCTYTSYLMSMR